MESLYMPFVVVAVATVWLVIAFTRYFNYNRRFKYPFMGMEGDSLSKSKARYVQEADVLLRDGYKKVKSLSKSLNFPQINVYLVQG